MPPLIRCFFFALLLALSVAPVRADTDTPDPHPSLGLQRPDGAGGWTAARVHAFARQADGRMLVGGEFLRDGSALLRPALLRVGRDGRLDPSFFIDLASLGVIRVNALAVDGDAIYVGGRFQLVGGQPRVNLAKLDANGALVTGWNAGLLDGDEIFAIAPAPEGIYVGGDIASLARYGLARLDRATGADDAGWRAQTQVFPTPTPSAGSRGRVYALRHTGTDLIVGGEFRQIAGAERASVARLGLQVPVQAGPFLSPISGGERIVYDLLLDERAGTLLLAGNFFAGTRSHLVRTDAATGALDTGWSPQPGATVRALARDGDAIYLGGDFIDASRAYLMRVSARADAAIDPSWLPLPDARVRALHFERGARRLWVAGDFVQIGGEPRNGLARFSLDGLDAVFRDGFEGSD